MLILGKGHEAVGQVMDGTVHGKEQIRNRQKALTEPVICNEIGRSISFGYILGASWGGSMGSVSPPTVL